MSRNLRYLREIFPEILRSDIAGIPPSRIDFDETDDDYVFNWDRTDNSWIRPWMQALANNTHVTKVALAVSGNEGVIEAFAYFGMLPNLTHFEISHSSCAGDATCYNLNISFIARIVREATQLRELHIDVHRMLAENDAEWDSWKQAVKNHSSLEKIKIGLGFFNDNGEPLNTNEADYWLEMFRSVDPEEYQRNARLQMWGARHFLSCVAASPTLKHLDIGDTVWIPGHRNIPLTQQIIPALQGLQTLASLKIIKVDFESLPILARMVGSNQFPHMTELEIETAYIRTISTAHSDGFFDAVAKMLQSKTLRKLRVWRLDKLNELDQTDSPLPNRDIPHPLTQLPQALKQCTQLEELSLRMVLKSTWNVVNDSEEGQLTKAFEQSVLDHPSLEKFRIGDEKRYYQRWGLEPVVAPVDISETKLCLPRAEMHCRMNRLGRKKWIEELDCKDEDPDQYRRITFSRILELKDDTEALFYYLININPPILKQLASMSDTKSDEVNERKRRHNE